MLRLWDLGSRILGLRFLAAGKLGQVTCPGIRILDVADLSFKALNGLQ